MEFRKIIKFGNSSHVISIPKTWLKENKLKKGDTIYIEENSNHELVISTGNEEKNEAKEITINIEKKDPEEIKRELGSTYLDGFNLINITGNLETKTDFIKKILDSWVAMEIIEQTPTKIVTKDLLNVNEISIKNLIRRIDIIIRSMFEDVELGMKEGIKKEQYENIYQRDNDINKIYLLIWKVIRKGLNNHKVAKVLNLNYNQLLDTWWLGMNLEYIGDELKRIARFLTKTKLNRKRTKQLTEVYSAIKEAYLNTMKAYHKNNKKLAFDVDSKRNVDLDKCDRFLKKNKDPTIGRTVEKLKYIRSFVHYISKIIMYKGETEKIEPKI